MWFSQSTWNSLFFVEQPRPVISPSETSEQQTLGALKGLCHQMNIFFEGL
jgi:hypothetical protein